MVKMSALSCGASVEMRPRGVPDDRPCPGYPRSPCPGISFRAGTCGRPPKQIESGDASVPTTTLSSAAKTSSKRSSASIPATASRSSTDMFGGTPSNLAITMYEPAEGRSGGRHQPADAGEARQGSRRLPLPEVVSAAQDAGPKIRHHRQPRTCRKMTTRTAPIIRVLEICNKKGLHARASAKFVQTVERFNADVKVTRDSETVGGTSIMGLMMLAAGPGSTIKSKPAARKPPK